MSEEAAAGAPDEGSGADGGTESGAGTGAVTGAGGAVGWLPAGPEAVFGAGARAEEAYGLLTVDVPADGWIAALQAARDRLGCTFFDWLSAVDEPGSGFLVCAHVVALPAAPAPVPASGDGDPARMPRVRRLLLRTTVPHDAPALPTATGVFAGAAWHERETHEMFGVDFAGHPHLVPLLLPDGFEGHPLRKDFVLAARVAKAWPGAKEPGESGHGGPKRRQMLPPGVPDPNEWGPLKGQLPPVPSRPARGRAAGRPGRRGAGEAGEEERPARRARSATAGSASQRAAEPAPEPAPDAAPGAPAERGAEREPAPEPKREPKPHAEPEAEGKADERTAREGPAPSASDAPWHHARPAFGEDAHRDPAGRSADRGRGESRDQDGEQGSGPGGEQSSEQDGERDGRKPGGGTDEAGGDT